MLYECWKQRFSHIIFSPVLNYWKPIQLSLQLSCFYKQILVVSNDLFHLAITTFFEGRFATFFGSEQLTWTQTCPINHKFTIAFISCSKIVTRTYKTTIWAHKRSMLFQILQPNFIQSDYSLSFRPKFVIVIVWNSLF